MRKKVFIGLLILFAVHIAFRIYEYRTDYLTPFNADYWKLKYENSQWSTKPACENLDPHVNPYTCIWDDQWFEQNKNNAAAADLKKNAIGDDGVYTYAGWEYIHGKDPTLLNAEIPPLGKYLIGLSELIFKNQNIFALLSGLFALYAFYLVNTLFFKSKLAAFIPVLLLSFEPLFFTQLQISLLDLLYIGLFFMICYFFLKKKYFASAVVLGLMAATKSTASTFPLVIGAIVLYLVVTKQLKLVKKYIMTLPIAGIVFVATYIQYFLLGNSFMDFLGVQKWIINFYAGGAKGSFSAPWEIIFTGKYANWWGQISVVDEWHFGWILLTVISAITIVFVFRKYRKSMIVFPCIWIIIYLLFLSFIPVWSRYFLLIIPFMYTLTVWLILYKIKKHEVT